MCTGPAVGSSSVAWFTPFGVSTSIALGTVPGSTAQIGLGLPAAHTPNEKSCGVAANARAWSELKPSWPVSTSPKDQPAAGVPKAEAGSATVIVFATVDATTAGVPSELPLASTPTGGARPG